MPSLNKTTVTQDEFRSVQAEYHVPHRTLEFESMQHCAAVVIHEQGVRIHVHHYQQTVVVGGQRDATYAQLSLGGQRPARVIEEVQYLTATAEPRSREKGLFVYAHAVMDLISRLEAAEYQV